jgi:hypothetical protein
MDTNKIQQKVMVYILDDMEIELQQPATIGFKCSGMAPLISVNMDDTNIYLDFEYQVDLGVALSDLFKCLPEDAHSMTDARRSEENYLRDELAQSLKGTGFTIEDSNWAEDTLILHVAQPLSEQSPQDVKRIFQFMRALKEALK